MAAAMLQTVQLRRVVHYGKLEEFVTLVTEVFPDILSRKEMIMLILGLRGRVSKSNTLGMGMCFDTVCCVCECEERERARAFIDLLGIYIRKAAIST